MKILIIVYLFLFTCINAQISQGNKRENNSEKEYFPLDTRKQLYFDSPIGEAKVFITQSPTEKIFCIESSLAAYRQFLIEKSDGIYLTSIEREMLFFDSKATFSQPMLYIPFPLRLEQKWESTALEFENGDTLDVIMRGTVIGRETIENEFGTFNCLIVETVTIEGGSDITKMTEWLAPNLGVVKAEITFKSKSIGTILTEFFGINKITYILTGIVD